MLFVPKLHLRQPVLSYNACGSFTKHPERIQNFRETGNLKHIYIYLYIYTNKLGKACFTHDATYSYSENLAKRTISEKILRERVFWQGNEIGNKGKYNWRTSPRITYASD